jgi:hypothetical protein
MVSSTSLFLLEREDFVYLIYIHVRKLLLGNLGCGEEVFFVFCFGVDD